MSDSDILSALSGKPVMRLNQELARELSRQRAHPAYIATVIATGLYIPARQRHRFDDDAMREELATWDSAIASYMQQHPKPILRPLTRFRLRALDGRRNIPTLKELRHALKTKFESMSSREVAEWTPPFVPRVPQRGHRH